MTLAELNHWAALYRWGDVRRAHLEAYVFQLAVIESSPALCQRWAEVTLATRKAGRPIACADAWIAATALELDCPLITHNARDYAMVPGLEIRSAAAAE